jgi:hypothetical protein
MREEWIKVFQARAQTFWTEERTQALIGDKKPPLLPAQAPILLRALGLLNADASLPATKVRKYRQINHMLVDLRPSLQVLAERFATVHLIDAGCGRSYLTMLVGWWLQRQGTPVRILGIDRNAAIINQCHRRAQAAGLEDILRFTVDDLTLDLKTAWHRAFGVPLNAVHGLFSLHACDTATDDALALAVAHQATFVAVAPCCQAELADAWDRQSKTCPNNPMAPLWQNGHLRRTAAATLTDTFRLLLLQACGYDAVATEFVEAMHTPKNTLIRAIKRTSANAAAAQRYRALRQATGGVGIGLETRLLNEQSLAALAVEPPVSAQNNNR